MEKLFYISIYRNGNEISVLCLDEQFRDTERLDISSYRTFEGKENAEAWINKNPLPENSFTEYVISEYEY